MSASCFDMNYIMKLPSLDLVPSAVEPMRLRARWLLQRWQQMDVAVQSVVNAM
jgi:hypothetical protein